LSALQKFIVCVCVRVCVCISQPMESSCFGICPIISSEHRIMAHIFAMIISGSRFGIE